MSITIAIIILTALISYQAFNRPDVIDQLIFYPAAVKDRGEYYRFITHGFIHADFSHLLFNMWALYIFGETAEYIFKNFLFKNQLLGGLMYLLFYLAAIAAASFVSYNRHKSSHFYRALGASGGVAAMMWPYIIIAPWNWFILPPLPAILLGPLYIAYSHYMDKQGRDNVGHNAHLWGAIFGLLVYGILLFFLSPELIEIFWQQLQAPRGPSFG